VRYGSVCSGIEAATVGWHGLGWTPAWLSEIEPFPNAVLAHHYPSVPNLGDMTTIASRVRAGEVEAPDVLVGGTPCQAFSVAGLRRSLSDARGNLALSYVELADAIDAVRAARGEPPAYVLWENVPGVLSVKDNAFGCLLAGLVGADAPVLPPRGKWPRAGVVRGPARVAAWRILDAQWLGVAQRRRRVFVLARGGPRAWAVADALLPLEQGVQRDPPSRGAARAGAADGARGGAAGGGGRAGVAPPLTSSQAKSRGSSNDGAMCVPEVAWCLQERDAKGPDSDTKPGHLIPCLPILSFQQSSMDGKGTLGVDEDTQVLRPVKPQADHQFIGLPIPFDTTQITHPENRSKCEPGSPSPSLAQAGHPPAIAFQCHGNNVGPMGTLRSGNGGLTGGVPAVAFHVTQDPVSGEVAPALGCGNRQGCGTLGVATPIDPDDEQALRVLRRWNEGDAGFATPIAFGVKDHGADAGELAPTLRAGGFTNSHANGGVMPGVAQGMAVRRLTPRECERLQGFPDDYTAIPGAKDGPRYRALGNSMAVPVMAYLGKRIAAVEAALHDHRE
jgi:DNA (cytosine-5)-methyltransferase 1